MVTCCELEPAVVEASVHFSSINHRPHMSSNFFTIYDDARSFLQRTSKSFDMIISEPSNPWMDGVAGLYTVEHFEASKRRLKQGGIYVQWVQTYNLEPQDYSLIVRTFTNTFLHYAVLVVQGGDTMLVGSDDSLELSPRTLSDVQSRFDAIPEVTRDLSRMFQTGNVRSLLMAHYLLDEEDVADLIKLGTGLNTDHNMRLAFDAPRRLFQQNRQSVEKAILSKIKVAGIRRRFQAWKCGTEQLSALRTVYPHLASRDDPRAAMELLELGLSVDPKDSGFQVNRQLLQMTRMATGFNREAIASIAKESPFDANRLGVALWQLRKYQLAVDVFKELVLAEPGSYQAWENLGTNYMALGQSETAKVAFERARQLDPCQRNK
jgi:hypothetical protein